MIYVRFFGRTGNQLFQYATGFALAKRLGVPLVLDDRHALHVGHGSLKNTFLLKTHTPDVLPPTQHQARLRYAVWRYGFGKPRFVREKQLGFDPAVLTLPKDSYLHGYWQSEKYFADCADSLRSSLKLPDATGRNLDLAHAMKSETSVSVHVRRGDYLGNPAHVVCTQTYYSAAVDSLLEGLEATPQFYVFSDEPEWARQNLKLPGNPVIVDHNGAESDFEDLRLMSMCQHNIIANSSFSWWGAWLNPSSDQRVIAPDIWYGKPGMMNPDIWADGWDRVKTR